MAHQYVVRPKVNKSGGEEKVLYYAVPKVKKQIGTKELGEIISQRSTFTDGDISGAVLLLAKVIQEEIAAGNSVHFENLGTFFLSAGSDGFKKITDCTPGKVRAHRICFKADAKVRSSMKDIEFELGEIHQIK